MTRDCTRCKLSASKFHKNIVWGEGPVLADIMLIGEAPGVDENETGHPFIGRAGDFLNEILAYCNVSRDSLYITNAVKCKPPHNRRPRTTERTACAVHLSRDLHVVRPRYVLTLGGTALKMFLPSVTTVGNVIGQRFTMPVRYGDEKGSFVLHPLYHPSYALRRASMISKMKDQYKAVFDEIRSSEKEAED